MSTGLGRMQARPGPKQFFKNRAEPKDQFIVDGTRAEREQSFDP